MFRFLLVSAALLGFCYHSFTVVEQSDGARYRAEIGRFQEQVATLTQERDSAVAELDAVKADETETKASDREQATDGETKVTPTPQSEN